MQTLEIRHLRMASAIAAAAGSMTRAADTLHLTPSAVSHQLRTLEDQLGLRLYLRVGKRMVPTAAGERLLGGATRILDDVIGLERELRRLGSHPGGLIRVCAQCNTGYHWLPPVVEAFQRRHPDVQVGIAVDKTGRPLDALLEGSLDVAIVTQPVSGEQFKVRALFEDEHAAIVSPAHPFANRPFVHPTDFATERLLLHSTSPDDSFTFQRILRPAGVTPERVSFLMLTEAIIEMVKARLGISVMQTWAVAPALRAGEVRAVSITRHGIHRQWSAVTLKAAGRVPLVDEFIDLVASKAIVGRPRYRSPSRRIKR